MDPKDWFQEETPPGHMDRVLSKTEEILKERRRRRFLNRWFLFLAPSFAVGMIAWIFQRKQNTNELREVALLDFVHDMEEGELDSEWLENFASLGDMETLEDFEDIEFLIESANQENI